MKVVNLRKESNADRVRIIATVIWENRDRPSQDVYFETTAEFGDALFLNPNSFLLACTLTAMRFEEKRIAIDAPISPEIKDGLINSMKCLINWQLKERQVIKIEAPIEKVLFADKPPRAGALFSGGIDALARQCCKKKR